MFGEKKKDQGGLSMAYAQIDPGASLKELRERGKWGNGKWEMGVTYVFLLLFFTICLHTNQKIPPTTSIFHLTRAIATNLDWLISLESKQLD